MALTLSQPMTSSLLAVRQALAGFRILLLAASKEISEWAQQSFCSL
jgi:hypothetical protein